MLITKQGRGLKAPKLDKKWIGKVCNICKALGTEICREVWWATVFALDTWAPPPKINVIL